jgi:hypothetical protein
LEHFQGRAVGVGEAKFGVGPESGGRVGLVFGGKFSKLSNKIKKSFLVPMNQGNL